MTQNPQNLQNYNRYAYVLNNPLKYTDPSGYMERIRRRDELTNEERVQSIQKYNFFGPKYGGGGNGFGWVSSNGMPAGYLNNGTGEGGYYYDYYTGAYRRTDTGEEVSYAEVYDNYIIPNGITFHGEVAKSAFEYLKSIISAQSGGVINQDGQNETLQKGYGGRSTNPIFIENESTAMNFIWYSSFNQDGTVNCETGMYKVVGGYVIMPNIYNDFNSTVTYFDTYMNNGFLDIGNGETYYPVSFIHVHPNDWGIGISGKDKLFNNTIQVYIIYKGYLYDIKGNKIKRVIQ